MKLMIFFHKICFSSRKFIKQLEPQLYELENELKLIKAQSNQIEAVVSFCQLMTTMQDKGGFVREIAVLQEMSATRSRKEITALQVIQKHINEQGRTHCGVNRAKPGEAVSADNVYLGGEFNFYHRKASTWLKEKEILMHEMRFDMKARFNTPVSEWFLIHDYQAGNWVTEWTDDMLQQIEVLQYEII